MERRHLDNADFRNIGDRRPDGNNISVHIEGKSFVAASEECGRV